MVRETVKVTEGNQEDLKNFLESWGFQNQTEDEVLQLDDTLLNELVQKSAEALLKSEAKQPEALMPGSYLDSVAVNSSFQKIEKYEKLIFNPDLGKVNLPLAFKNFLVKFKRFEGILGHYYSRDSKSFLSVLNISMSETFS